MRKKIILGTVILAAIIAGIFLFNNLAVINSVVFGNRVVFTNITEINCGRYDRESKDSVYCTPSLKKLKKLESLIIFTSYDTDFKYLSQMNDLRELYIDYMFYVDDYIEYVETNGTLPEFYLETLPELPNLKNLTLYGSWGGELDFALSDENKYNFSSIENLKIYYFTDIDFNSLKHFKNLKTLELHVMTPLSDMECFSELQYLETAEFCVYLKKEDIVDLSGLKNNKNLKSLTVNNYYDDKFILKNTGCFSDLASVETLEMTNISVENTDGLLKMKSLKNLNVDNDCLTEKQIEELRSRGINVEIVQGDF